MGQDSIYLQVLAGDPDESQSKNAKRVYDLLKKGKHWVLVTLLLSNVIVNESLPIVLDRCLGGGVTAVVGSTILIGKFYKSPAPSLTSAKHLRSHFRRSRSPIRLRPLRSSDRWLHVQAGALAHVAYGAHCLAHC